MLYTEAVNKFLNHLNLTNKSSKTIKGYTSDLRRFEAFVCQIFNCDFYIEDITTEHIEDFSLSMKQRGLSTACICRMLYALRSFFKFLVKKKYLAQNIALEVEVPRQKKVERTYLIKSQDIDLIEAIDHPLIKYFVITLLYSGMRISEALNLKNADVDMDRKIIKVIAGKGNKDRNIPMNPKLYDFLQEYIQTIKNKESDNFFATSSSNGLSAVYVNSHIREAAKKVGLKGHITAHTFRHTFATKILSVDKDLVNVKTLLGHTSLSTTGIYLHTDFERLTKAVGTL